MKSSVEKLSYTAAKDDDVLTEIANQHILEKLLERPLHCFPWLQMTTLAEPIRSVCRIDHHLQQRLDESRQLKSNQKFFNSVCPAAYHRRLLDLYNNEQPSFYTPKLRATPYPLHCKKIARV